MSIISCSFQGLDVIWTIHSVDRTRMTCVHTIVQIISALVNALFRPSLCRREGSVGYRKIIEFYNPFGCCYNEP